MVNEINNTSQQQIKHLDPPGEAPQPDMTWTLGGTFCMGSEDFYPEEAPIHTVSVDNFRMDRTQVTNSRFKEFVNETGYGTVEECMPKPEDYPGAPPAALVSGSLTFQKTKGLVDLRQINLWWIWTPGSSWTRPEEPHNTIKNQEHHPAVYIAYEDALSYAAWAGKILPSEADWEFATHGGLDGAIFVWVDNHFPNNQPAANIWQGDFPWQKLELDGFIGTSPVGSFPANRYWLYDTAENVGK